MREISTSWKKTLDGGPYTTKLKLKFNGKQKDLIEFEISLLAALLSIFFFFFVSCCCKVYILTTCKNSVKIHNNADRM